MITAGFFSQWRWYTKNVLRAREAKQIQKFIALAFPFLNYTL